METSMSSTTEISGSRSSMRRKVSQKVRLRRRPCRILCKSKGIAVDSDGSYLRDRCRIQQFSDLRSPGQCTAFCRENGSAPGELYLPAGICDRRERPDLRRRSVQLQDRVFQYLKNDCKERLPAAADLPPAFASRPRSLAFPLFLTYNQTSNPFLHGRYPQQVPELLAVEKGLSRNTLLSYERDLTGICTWMQGKHPDQVSQATSSPSWPSFSAAGLSPASTARNLAAIRGFHKYLLIDGTARQDPTVNSKHPGGWKRLPAVLSAADVETLLDQPDLSHGAGLRDKAMLELLYATGLRVSELVGLRLGDINLKRGFLIVMGKGPRNGRCPWASRPWLRSGLPDAGAAAPAQGRRVGRPLSSASRRKGMTRQMFWERIKLYALQGGHREEHITPYPPPFLRNPSARQRSGPPRGPGNARPFRYLDDPDLYACFPRTAEEDPRKAPPERMRKGKPKCQISDPE